MSYIVAIAARWKKSLKFTLWIAVHRGGLAKNHFWLVATQKKRIGEQLNYFWNMCPKPFSWAKNKRKLFSDGKSRGPLLARVALKSACKRLITSESGAFSRWRRCYKSRGSFPVYLASEVQKRSNASGPGQKLATKVSKSRAIPPYVLRVNPRDSRW